MKILAIICGIIAGACAFILLAYLFYWFIVKPGREAAEDNKGIYERYQNPKK